MSLSLLNDLFRAYFDARKHKRGTSSATRFEMNFEEEILNLYKEIVSRRYEISPSSCFISFYPVKREIFAGDFRDRVVHHLVFNYLSPLCEKVFIYDSCSCRKGKGTSFGGERAEHFMRSCSKNYHKDCYVLKLDISGYFMSIDKKRLYLKILKLVKRFENKINFDLDLILWLIRKIVFNDPTKDCIMKGKREDWVGMAKTKSLFWAEAGRGLPIGNLTSQLFANIYLNDLDHLMKYSFKFSYYCRYVDDFLIFHQDKRLLKSLYPTINLYLKEHLGLSLHPKKIYLQHFFKGVVFLGRVVLPHRNYIRNRTKGKAKVKIKRLKGLLKEKPYSKKIRKEYLACANSYNGILAQSNTFKLRKKIFCYW